MISTLLNCWHFAARHPRIVMVLIGVAGEVLFDWKDMKGKRTWDKRLSAIILITGLFLELFEAATSDKEYAALSIKTAQLHSNNLAIDSQNLQLEQQLQQTRTNVANIDPMNQSVSDISCSAVLYVKRGPCKFKSIPANTSVASIRLMQTDAKPYNFPPFLRAHSYTTNIHININNRPPVENTCALRFEWAKGGRNP